MLEFEGYSNLSLGTCALVVIAVLHRIYKVFYDLYLHPLARIPGPKLAAITYLYQTYYSLLIGGSRFYVKIGKLHDQYGRKVHRLKEQSCMLIFILQGLLSV